MRRPALLLALLLSLGMAAPFAATAQTPAAEGSSWADLVAKTPGLTAFWRLDEPTGKAIDRSPDQHDADWPEDANRLGPSLLPTDNDASASFTGAEGQAVDAGDVLDFPGRAPFTVSFWVFPGQQTAPYPRFVSKEGSNDAGRQGFLIYENADNGLVGIERWRDGTPDVLTTPDPLPNDRPSFIAATFDGGTLRFFVDGSKVAEGSASVELLDTDFPLRLGARSDGTSPFAGLLDEVAVFNRALAPEEIASLYVTGSGLQPGEPLPVPAGVTVAAPAATPDLAVDSAIVVGTVAPAANAAQTPAANGAPAVAEATPPAGEVVEETPAPDQNAGQQAAAPATQAVTTDELNLRAGPSQDADVLDLLPAGTTVDLLGDSVGDYVSVSVNGTVGWVAREYLKAP